MTVVAPATANRCREHVGQWVERDDRAGCAFEIARTPTNSGLLE